MIRNPSHIASILAARGKDTFVTQNGLCAIRGESSVALANVSETDARKVLSENPQFKNCTLYNLPLTRYRSHHEGLYSTRETRSTPAREFYQTRSGMIPLDKVELSEVVTGDSTSDNRRSGEWVSASQTRNHLLRDPIVDYLQYKPGTHGTHGTGTLTARSKRQYDFKGRRLGKKGSIGLPGTPGDKKKKTADTYTDDDSVWRMQQGNKFEEIVVSELIEKFGTQVVQIGSGHGDSSSLDKYNATVDAMRTGVPFIYQAVVHDTKNQTFGSPDLLVRTDYLDKLVNVPPPIETTETVFGEYGYCVVDIKWCTLNFRVNGTTLLTKDSVPAYKGQCWVYNQALGQMQGVTPRYAYILGRGWYWQRSGIKLRGTNAFDRLGAIDYQGIDESFSQRTLEAIEWRRRLGQLATKNAKPGDPEYPELYPNMNQDTNKTVKIQKKALADEIGEITSLWNCGVDDRLAAHAKKVYSWHDPRFNSRLIGWKNPNRCDILDRILAVNRGETEKPWLLGSNFSLHHPPIGTREMFIDFESTTANSVPPRRENGELVSPNGSFVYMVGVGHVEDGEWVYKGFIADELTPEGELRLFAAVHEYLQDAGEYVGYHWHDAENRMFNAAVRRLSEIGNYPLILEDLLEHVRSAPFTVKGALNFSLKSIGRALYDLKEIDLMWEDENSYTSVMSRALDAYRTDDPYSAMGSVLRYNEVDCRMMYEILEFIRRESQ